jgi:hypothetical protein
VGNGVSVSALDMYCYDAIWLTFSIHYDLQVWKRCPGLPFAADQSIFRLGKQGIQPQEKEVAHRTAASFLFALASFLYLFPSSYLLQFHANAISPLHLGETLGVWGSRCRLFFAAGAPVLAHWYFS